jgi:predicted metal-dependent peptidase
VLDGLQKCEVYKIFVEESDGRTPLERPRHRWNNNIDVGPL